jgi:tellurite resistance protein TehA-like permease
VNGGVSLYAALWRRLPGRWPIKLAIVTVVVAVACVLLFVVVFPWVEPRLPFNHVTVDSPGAGG